MTEEQLEERRRHAKEKVPSMKRRGASHDYSSECFYMLTMAVEGRRPLLGRVVGCGDAPDGAPDAPHVELTELGDAVRRAWWDISSYYPQVAVVALQVMPDHIHGILYFREQVEGLHLGHVVRGFKAGCNHAYRRLVPAATVSQLTREGQLHSPGISSSASPSSSSSSGLLGGEDGGPSLCAVTPSQPEWSCKGTASLLWEQGYNDRILHNYSTLENWKAYLADNPRRLLMKREHPELFRVQRNLLYAGLSFSAIGNRFLLDNPLKVQVQCSRSITAEALAEKQRAMLALGSKGAVFVSPCISPGEKAIMRAAFDAGFPVIFLEENGFTDLAKPGGRRFDACARGQMLILAPWEHHNEHISITRDKCLILNSMAEQICQYVL